jgi:hypothetical protein
MTDGRVPMAKIKVQAGDFNKGDASYSFGMITLKTKEHSFLGENMKVKDTFEAVEIATEESAVKLGGAVGWGAAGALLAGPVGLLAGAVLGGRGKDVVFVAKLKDGRKFMGQTDSKTFTKLKAEVF